MTTVQHPGSDTAKLTAQKLATEIETISDSVGARLEVIPRFYGHGDGPLKGFCVSFPMFDPMAPPALTPAGSAISIATAIEQRAELLNRVAQAIRERYPTA